MLLVTPDVSGHTTRRVLLCTSHDHAVLMRSGGASPQPPQQHRTHDAVVDASCLEPPFDFACAHPGCMRDAPCPGHAHAHNPRVRARSRSSTTRRRRPSRRRALATAPAPVPRAAARCRTSTTSTSSVLRQPAPWRGASGALLGQDLAACRWECGAGGGGSHTLACTRRCHSVVVVAAGTAGGHSPGDSLRRASFLGCALPRPCPCPVLRSPVVAFPSPRLERTLGSAALNVPRHEVQLHVVA